MLLPPHIEQHEKQMHCRFYMADYLPEMDFVVKLGALNGLDVRLPLHNTCSFIRFVLLNYCVSFFVCIS